MAEEVKKISFGFTKLSKNPKPTPKRSLKVDESIELIDCLVGKTIQIKGLDEKNIIPSGGLVIPLSTSSPHAAGSKLRDIIGGTAPKNLPSSCGQDDDKPCSIAANDLDSIAIKEILEDARKINNAKETKSNFTLELALPGQEPNIDKESTLEDYESVPVADYGLAMLRGMGWTATKGIGKTEKVVPTLEPKVRPRGMGLGVSMEGLKKPVIETKIPTKTEEELKIVKGAYVQVTSGSKKDSYGQIEGFNEETGRLILKMALGGSSLSVSEYMVNPVTKDEYNKNSRVLNTSKYNEYKDKESGKKENGSSKSSHRSRDNKEKHSHKSSRRDRSRSPRRH